VRGLSSREVAELGFQLVLGNTFHLHLAPGEEAIAARGGLHRFMGWERAIITDSGGFQVFSLAHGGVADEIKGRRGAVAGGAKVEIGEEGVAFQSLLDGSNRFLGPEESMRIQAALGSDIALTFDECTPFHADRDYTARSTERTHRWLDRCLAWHEREGPASQAVFGIVQGGVHEDLRRESAQRNASALIDGIAIGGTLGREKEQMHGVLGFTLPHLPADAPRHLLGIGEIDDLLAGIGMGIDLFDCAIPTRLARHGTALAPEPEGRFRIDLTKSAYADDDSPVVEDCGCEACSRHSRAYLHYLARNKDLTGTRLLTLHNLTFMERLTGGAREAIGAGRYIRYTEEILAGAPPWAVPALERP
jgi:queuine tRNA-ribosyltransferase